MAIGIIDYSMGNLQSVKNALDYIGKDSFISSRSDVLAQADKIILPGVGAFKDAIALLKEKKLDRFLEQIVEQEIPLLGICLGMQLLFETSTEFGHHTGLGLIEGEIIKFQTNKLKVPHMGWNTLNVKKNTPLFADLPENPQVYFVHSYHLSTSADVVIGTTDYEKEIQIAVEKGSVYGLQFHPEKSGEVGLQILKNFAHLNIFKNK